MGCLNPGCPNGRACPDRPIPGCWSQPPLAPIVLAGVVVATWPQGPVPGIGFTIHEVAYAVARAESGRNPSACNWVSPPAGCECSLGLWQVFWGCHPQFPIRDLLDPWFNARAARELSDNGRWWMPWSPFRNGAYRAYIGEARRAIADFAAAFPPPPLPPPAVVFRLAGRTCDQWALWAYLQQLIAVGLVTLSNLRTLSRDGDVDGFVQRAFGRNGFGTVHTFGIALACAGGTPPPPQRPPPGPPPLPPPPTADGRALAPILLLVGAGLIVAAVQRR